MIIYLVLFVFSVIIIIINIVCVCVCVCVWWWGCWWLGGVRSWDLGSHVTATNVPDNKVHGANMGPTWVLSAPDGPHVGPMNLAIRGSLQDKDPAFANPGLSVTLNRRRSYDHGRIWREMWCMRIVSRLKAPSTKSIIARRWPGLSNHHGLNIRACF